LNSYFPFVHTSIKKEIAMSQPIVFITHFKVKDGTLAEVKQLSQNVSEYIQDNKPGTVAFLQFTNQEGTELSIIHMFPDAEAFDRHMEGAGERSNKALEYIVPTSREFYGLPSDGTMGMLTPPDGSGITLDKMPQFIDGYIRSKPE
jgi:hypothetical protein